MLRLTWKMRSGGIGVLRVSESLYQYELKRMSPTNISFFSPAQGFPKARERLEDLKKGGSRMQKTRLSRSAVNKQSDGDCTVM